MKKFLEKIHLKASKVFTYKTGLRVSHITRFCRYSDEWEEERTQSVVTVTYLFGLTINECINYHEIVPSYAWIGVRALGSTDWKSTLPEWAFKLPKI